MPVGTAPRVVLAALGQSSVAATVFGLIDRGVMLRPDVAAELAGSVLLCFEEGYAAVRVDLSADLIVVGDDGLGDEDRAVDLEVRAALPDFVMLVSAPLAGGLPKPTDRRGRAALTRLADGRVELTGSLRLARRFLRLMTVAPAK